MAVNLPVFYQLFGPEHRGYIGQQGPSWQMPDTANSSSIKPFYFHMGMPHPAWVTWTLIWQPGANGTSKTRLIMMDTGGPGYGNWEELAVFDGPPNRGPMISALDLTAKFQQLVLDKKSKYIGFQMMDDAVNPYTLWESRIEVVWEI